MQRSKHLIIFLVRLMGTSSFWLLFLSSFTAVLMMAWRGTIRDEIFKMAQKTLGKRGW